MTISKTSTASIYFQRAEEENDWNCIVLLSNDESIRFEVYTDDNGDIGEVLCCGTKNVSQEFFNAVNLCETSDKQFFNLLFDELEKTK